MRGSQIAETEFLQSIVHIGASFLLLYRPISLVSFRLIPSPY